MKVDPHEVSADSKGDRISGANALVEILNGYGVEHVFCSPGSEWPPFWEELARRAARAAGSQRGAHTGLPEHPA